MRFIISLFIIMSLNIYAEDDLLDSFEDEFSAATEKKSDPLSGYNKMMTKYNDIFYTKVFFPISDKYAEIVAEPIRLSIANFFDNLKFPIRFINNTAQLKFKNSLEESERFIINSTIGLAGLFDIAKYKFNIKKHNEDFGQTLGYYGVGSGFHIVLPFLGPSNLRDSLSILVDSQADVIYYLDYQEAMGSKTLYYTNEASFKSKEYKSLKQNAIELYPYLKDIYEQHRESEIKRWNYY